MYVTKNLDQALVDLKAVANLRPNNSEALQSLGFALRRSGHMDEALEVFNRSWELDPLNPAYTDGPIITLLGLRRFEAAIKQTELYSARFPNDPASYLARGRLRSRLTGSAEPLKAALRDYGRMLKDHGRNQVEGRIAVIEGRYLDSAQLLSKLPGANDPLGWGFNIACLYYAAGEKERAEQIFGRAEARLAELRQADPNAEPSLEILNVRGACPVDVGKA